MYLIIYDYTDEEGNEELNIHEDFHGDWDELKEYIKQMKRNGCYNIEATAIEEA